MNRSLLFISMAAPLLCAALCLAQTAPDTSSPAPPDYKLLLAMAACSDMPCLDSHRLQVGNNKLAKIVYYEKWILLEHSKAAAEGLLRNLPQTDLEQSQFMTLRDWHPDANKPKDSGLAEIYESWPRSLGDAVLAFPQFLPLYIRYGLLARQDSHSDYTGNEERVCHEDASRFQDAFYRLDRKSQTELRKFVFNPDKCRAIFVSEGD
ncbi:MAG TPA: hypothetical protein VKV39_16045 [Candidatus Sulfotelmatobacter sp.]|nr:hypothetical protein [Candidatus Sulfotelmatobacter sp.]